MFADIAQEGQHIHIAEPVIVIRGDGGVFTAIEIQERCNLFADFIHPFLHGFFCIQFTLGGLKARVANQTGRAAHQCNWLMPCLLETLQAQQRNQMAQMQAIGGRIEAAIECDWPLRQSLC